jgi:quercetin dioxygenase-like cupin family protein
MTRTPAPQAPSAADDLDEAVSLLSEALAAGWPPRETPSTMRERVLQRVAASAARHQGLITVRRGQGPTLEPAPGVRLRWLYRCADGAALRPGEPVALALLELAPGATLSAGLGLAGQASEWLVLRGECTIDGVALSALDLQLRAATPAEPVLASASGAMVYVRNSGRADFHSQVLRERDALWEDFGPGIRRRVVWQQGQESCYLARAEAGAYVPPHGHHVDEECLMVEGELFLGDILLREGEFQLAPAGLEHGRVQAASETLLYVRGDIVPAVELAQG